jgi:hypothetical protein
MHKARRLMERALPGMQKSLETNRKLAVDDFLRLAKTAYFSYATVPVSSYSEATTLDVIIGSEREILNAQRNPNIPGTAGIENGVSAPKKVAKRKEVVPPPTKKVPLSVQNARNSLSRLFKDGDIHPVDRKATFENVRIYFGPFDVAVRTDAELGTLELISTVAQVSSTAPLEELFSELPIGPVELSYKLEIPPTVQHHGRMALTSAADPDYLLKFIKQHVLSTLVLALVLVSSDLLISPTQQQLNVFQLNKGQKYFEDVLSYEDLLQRHPK